MTNPILVGTFSGAFGVKGEVRLKSFCAEPGAIADYVPLTTKDGRTFNQIVITGQLKGAFTAQINGIITKEDADALRDTKLYADRDKLPGLPDDEYYHTDLIGLQVYDTGGALIGSVKDVMNNGSDDLLEVLLPGQSDTALLPFTRAAVPTVDLATGRIIADPPDGIF